MNENHSIIDFVQEKLNGTRSHQKYADISFHDIGECEMQLLSLEAYKGSRKGTVILYFGFKDIKKSLSDHKKVFLTMHLSEKTAPDFKFNMRSIGIETSCLWKAINQLEKLVGQSFIVDILYPRSRKQTIYLGYSSGIAQGLGSFRFITNLSIT
jgi:hypothetical protein